MPRRQHRPVMEAIRARLPRRTVRLRLTVLYGGLFLAAGAALLAITYVLVERASSADVPILTLPSDDTVSPDEDPTSAPPRPENEPAVNESESGDPPRPPTAEEIALRDFVNQQDANQLRDLLVQSCVALAVMAVASIGLGWFVAGRVLRPLRTITATARDISGTNLQRRLAVDGPDDELKELGDTFDALLARLEAAFTAQQRFVANAAHELRTPLARQRTLIQVALADPDRSEESLRATHERVLASGREQERLIDALLTLARGQTGLDRRAPFDLAVVVNDVVLRRQPEADTRNVNIEAALAPAPTAGDQRLVERLVTNLVDNAVRHNTPQHENPGRVDIVTETRSDRSVLTVTNTGPLISTDAMGQLFVPFRRLGTDRAAHHQGLGLGLSIVKAIADAHDATLTVNPNTDGGLRIEVGFPER